MDVKNNPYAPLTPEKIKEKEAEKKAIESRLSAVLENAKACLDDPKFKKYRESYEEFRLKAFECLNTLASLDPIQDAYYLRSCINTILVLDLLLSGPNKDIKSGGK
jgi:hypothetical protein